MSRLPSRGLTHTLMHEFDIAHICMFSVCFVNFVCIVYVVYLGQHEIFSAYESKIISVKIETLG